MKVKKKKQKTKGESEELLSSAKQVMDFKNEVVLEGVVAAIRENQEKNMATITLAIKKTETNFPICLCFGQVKEKALGFSKGDHVIVTAMIESKKVPVLDETGKAIATKMTQACIATDIIKSVSMEEMEFGVPGKTFPTQNKVVLSGTVNGVKKFGEKRVGLSVYTLNGKIPNRIMVMRFVRNADEFMKEYEKGEKVCVIGEIQTLPPKEGTSRKEAVVAHSIKKCE